MKRKRLKNTMVAAIACMALIASLTACGGKNEGTTVQGKSSSETVNNEVSLSGTPSTLFNSDERRLWYRTIHQIAKDTGADLYVFENGKVTHYFTDLGIKLGDLDGKSDDEIIAMYEAAAEYIDTVDSFSLHIFTDKTGNNTEYEKLDIPFVEDSLKVEFYSVSTMAYQIYSTNYAAFTGEGSTRLFDSFLTKVDGAFDLSLDQPGADGVEVD